MLEPSHAEETPTASRGKIAASRWSPIVMIASSILLVVAGYFAIGVVCAALFIVRGISQIDPAAHAATWSFRILIMPGAAAMWPLVMTHWFHATRGRQRR